MYKISMVDMQSIQFLSKEENVLKNQLGEGLVDIGNQ